MNEYNYNDKGEKHGYWEDYYYIGNIWCIGKYINGFATGYWEWHDDKGELIEKEFYL
jgi:hypothetical protein